MVALRKPGRRSDVKGFSGLVCGHVLRLETRMELPPVLQPLMWSFHCPEVLHSKLEQNSSWACAMLGKTSQLSSFGTDGIRSVHLTAIGILG